MKKLTCLLFSILLVMSLTACGVEIEDTNGDDDYSLATITEENILKLDLGGSSYSTSGDDITTGQKYSSKNFSGVVEIYTISLLGKSDIEIDLASIFVKKGNFKLVVVVDDEIVHEFDNEEMMQTFRLDDISGDVSIRMAGESASFEFYIQVF